jgi:hypothetical protein
MVIGVTGTVTQIINIPMIGGMIFSGGGKVPVRLIQRA